MWCWAFLLLQGSKQTPVVLYPQKRGIDDLQGSGTGPEEE